MNLFMLQQYLTHFLSECICFVGQCSLNVCTVLLKQHTLSAGNKSIILRIHGLKIHWCIYTLAVISFRNSNNYTLMVNQPNLKKETMTNQADDRWGTKSVCRRRSIFKYSIPNVRKLFNDKLQDTYLNLSWFYFVCRFFRCVGFIYFYFKIFMQKIPTKAPKQDIKWWKS